MDGLQAVEHVEKIMWTPLNLPPYFLNPHNHPLLLPTSPPCTYLISTSRMNKIFTGHSAFGKIQPKFENLFLNLFSNSTRIKLLWRQIWFESSFDCRGFLFILPRAMTCILKRNSQPRNVLGKNKALFLLISSSNGEKYSGEGVNAFKIAGTVKSIRVTKSLSSHFDCHCDEYSEGRYLPECIIERGPFLSWGITGTHPRPRAW